MKLIAALFAFASIASAKLPWIATGPAPLYHPIHYWWIVRILFGGVLR